MSRLLVVCALLGFAPFARAEDGPVEESPEAEVVEELPALPPPTLDEAEPVVPAPPEGSQPQILLHIGPGDHPEWETDADEPELPRDIAFEIVPASDHRLMTNMVGGQVYGVDPEEPVPPFVVTVGAGYARFLGPVPVDFFRIEQRFEARVPGFETLRLGASAAQMIGENGYIVGGGVRIGMAVSLCENGTALLCEGVVIVQPGFLTGLIGTRFDLNASVSFRVIVERLVQLAIDGGYSLGFGGNGALLHLTGQAGFVF